MDVIRLNSTTFFPDIPVEGFTSIIWTERYQTPGDFELKTPLIEETMATLYKGALISLLDAIEVMMVETHAISVNAEGIEELTISGRSLVAFLEHRIFDGNYQKWFSMPYKTTIPTSLEILLWNAVCNTTKVDVIHAGGGNPNEPKNAIPNVVISDSVAGTTYTTGIRYLVQGSVWDAVDYKLKAGGIGIRAMRPAPDKRPEDYYAQQVAVSTTSTPPGLPVWTSPALFTKLRFDVYDGEDATPYVIFSYEEGDFDSANYLMSIKDYKTYVLARANGSEGWYTKGISSTGFNRREMCIDGGSPDSGENMPDFLQSLEDIAQATVNEHTILQMVDVEVSPSVGGEYVYGLSYSLGDTVSVVGKFNISQNMIVSEYTRTEDENGERGFPSLVTALPTTAT